MGQSSRFDRREFLVTAASGAVIVGVGCTGSSSDGPELGPDASADSADGGLPPTCGELTDSNIEGPFFTPDSPERSVIVDQGAEGERIIIAGKVYSQDCEPLAGALVDVWQADNNGDYDNAGFTFRGHQFTDEEGNYQLETIIPGRYLNGAEYRPAHIHVKVGSEGFRLLTTQLYFSGDPFNESDAFILPSLIMDVAETKDGNSAAYFDFVLSSE